MATVYVTKRIPPEHLARIAGFDVGVWEGDGPVPRDQLLEEVADVRGLLTMLTDRIDGELLDGAPRLTDVVARVDTRTLVIDRRDFLDLLADRPELLTGVFRVLSRQLKSVVMELSNRRNTGDVPKIAG